MFIINDEIEERKHRTETAKQYIDCVEDYVKKGYRIGNLDWIKNDIGHSIKIVIDDFFEKHCL